MTALKIYKGRKGADGKDGINGTGPADVDSFNLSEPILDCLNLNVLSKNATIAYEKTGRSSFTDRYGKLSWGLSRNITNYCIYSNNFQQWGDLLNRWTYIGQTTDPFGGNEASEINLDVDTSSLVGTGDVMELVISNVPSGFVVISFYIKVISGTVTSLDIVKGSTKYQLEPPTSEYKRVAYQVEGGGSFLLSINPRGLTGARIAVFGVQVEDSNALSDLIYTNGTVRSRFFGGDITKQGLDGYLVEGQKTNLIHHSNDLSEWTITNGTASQYAGLDPFGFYGSYTSINFASVDTVILETTTETLTPGQTYTVSVFSWITAGSLESITMSLGGGAEVLLPTPPVLGFQRFDVKMIAGNENDFTVSVKSPSLSAKLLLSCFQVESGDLSSYVMTGQQSATRDADLISMDYAYNIPKPSDQWTFVFGKNGMINSSTKKIIFSNGESGVNEFSFSFTNKLLTVNNGGNTSSVDAFNYEKVAITYDGANVKFYGEQTLLLTESLSSTSFIANSAYIGSDGSSNFANCYLSGIMFFTKELSLNEIEYLMGA